MRDGKPLPTEGYAVPREGVVEYQHFTVKTNFPEDRWIQALEVKPGAADVVHHVLVAIQQPNGGIDERSYRSEEHTSELQSHRDIVCRPLLVKKKKKQVETNTNMTRIVQTDI